MHVVVNLMILSFLLITGIQYCLIAGHLETGVDYIPVGGYGYSFFLRNLIKPKLFLFLMVSKEAFPAPSVRVPSYCYLVLLCVENYFKNSGSENGMAEIAWQPS